MPGVARVMRITIASVVTTGHHCPRLARGVFMPFKAARRIAVAALLAIASSGSASAQQPAAPAPAAPDVGTMAPDFTLTGATRYGVLRDPVHLSDFRGKTVVLAFFYQARTKG
jgi:cytochrome oxidase Cu insertion factor (SCO1/SenC/PrrC family)